MKTSKSQHSEDDELNASFTVFGGEMSKRQRIEADKPLGKKSSDLHDSKKNANDKATEKDKRLKKPQKKAALKESNADGNLKEIKQAALKDKKQLENIKGIISRKADRDESIKESNARESSLKRKIPAVKDVNLKTSTILTTVHASVGNKEKKLTNISPVDTQHHENAESTHDSEQLFVCDHEPKNDFEKKYTELKKAYDQLSLLTVNEAEKTFDQLKLVSQERFDHYEELVIKQQSQIKRLALFANETSAILETTKNALTIAVDKNYLYEKLSGTSILSVKQGTQIMENSVMEPLIDATGNAEEAVTHFECKHSGKNGTIHYTLTVPETTPYISYTPNTSPQEMIALGLPEYLQEDIEFENGMTDLFFWRVSDWLQK